MNDSKLPDNLNFFAPQQRYTNLIILKIITKNVSISLKEAFEINF
jgi:hypothetical protein